MFPFVSRLGDRRHPAAPGRYHLYLHRGCPRAHVAAIVRSVQGLTETISASYVDDERDGRGWAFRSQSGPDPVNGFTLLREAYEATEPGYDGHISVPVLWDRTAERIVTNVFTALPQDLATRFDEWAVSPQDLYPAPWRSEIDLLDRGVTAISPTGGPHPAHGPEALNDLDSLLGARRHLVGDRLTLADIRLWVKLVRYGTEYRPAVEAYRRDLRDYPNVWAYARRLYALEGFRRATDHHAITRSAERHEAQPPPPLTAWGL
jgi:glutathionyl-hydroquinone reductase